MAQINRLLLTTSFTAGLGGLLFGFDTAVIAGCTGALKTLYQLSDPMLGFVVATALIGTILGSLGAVIPAERFGRKYTLMMIAILFFASGIGCAAAWDVWSLIAFRFMGGLAIGGASVIAPMYLAEVAPAALRGRLVGCFQINIVLGILGAFLSNYLIGRYFPGEMEWRIKFGVEAIPALIFFFALLKVPFSPRWLASKGRNQEAEAVLKSIGETDSRGALETIRQSLAQSSESVQEPLFQARYATPVFLAISIAFFNQMSGINGLLYYINDIFAQGGFDKVSSDLQSVAVGLTNLIFTLIAMSIIDRVGRKILLLIGSIGTALSLFCVSYIYYTGIAQNMLLYLFIFFIASFAISQGAVIWVYISEIFPTQVRAKGQSLGSFTHWVLCALVSYAFPILAKGAPHLPFMIFAIMMLVQFFVVALFFPETKVRNLEDCNGSNNTTSLRTQRKSVLDRSKHQNTTRSHF